MYFDLKPKKNREDLYNFDEQVERLRKFFGESPARSPLVAVTGIRRIGKTSLLNTSLNESELLYLILDGREFASGTKIKKKGFMRKFENDLNRAVSEQKEWHDKIADLLGGIQWIRVSEDLPFIQFEWERDAAELDPLDILTTLDDAAGGNGDRFILVLDEAQEFRKVMGVDMQNLISYIYDRFDHTQVVVSGSQIGVLYDFLNLEGPDSALYGRGMKEVKVPRLSKEDSMDFLRKGFGQAEFEPEADVLKSAVERLDGIIGWLTLFGSVALDRGEITEQAIEKTSRKGAEMQVKEFENFLQLRPSAEERYTTTLEIVAQSGKCRWKEIKKGLELEEGQKIGDNRVTGLLSNLKKNGFLNKNSDGTYSIPDPMLLRAVKEDML